MGAAILISLLCAITIGVHGFRVQEGNARAEVRVAYNLWFQPDPQSEDHLGAVQNVGIEDKSSFYNVMVAAANSGADNEMQFKFAAINYTFGHYVTSIGGFPEDSTRNLYWMIYKFPQGEEPNPQNPPPDSYLSDVGVDAIEVSNGDVYLFWRKIVTWAN